MSETTEFDSTNLNTLLSTWEEVYKRGLLSFWILLLVQYKESYAYEMAEKIGEVSKGSISAGINPSATDCLYSFVPGIGE